MIERGCPRPRFRGRPARLLSVGFMAVALLSACDDAGAEYDVLIRGGEVIDGSGSEPFQADVAIRDGTVVEVGDLTGATGP